METCCLVCVVVRLSRLVTGQPSFDYITIRFIQLTPLFLRFLLSKTYTMRTNRFFLHLIPLIISCVCYLFYKISQHNPENREIQLDKSVITYPVPLYQENDTCNIQKNIEMIQDDENRSLPLWLFW